MKVQAIDLSEIEILRRFSEMEKHFPRCTGKNFFPSLDFYLNYYENPEKAIKVEADNMFAYVGMGRYVTEVMFDNLTNAAGNIKLTSDNKAIITIDNNTAKDAKRVLATLAHEICHKILYKNDIYFKNFLEEENEIYADLATFYVGFGNLTMDGYKVGNAISGYLTPSTYGRAFHIIKTINSDIDYTVSTLPEHAKAEIGKAEAESLFSKLLKDSLKKEKLSDIFKMACSNVAHAQFLCDLLINTIKEKSDKYKDEIHKISQSFYGYEEKDFEWHKFAIAFRYMEYASFDKLPNNSKQIIDEILKLASFLQELYPNDYEKKISTLNTKFSCPVCGIQINKELEQKVYHLICPQCKSHIIIDTSKVNVLEDISYVTKQMNSKIKSYQGEIQLYKNKYNQIFEEKKSLEKDLKACELLIRSLEDKLKRKWYKKLFG